MNSNFMDEHMDRRHTDIAKRAVRLYIKKYGLFGREFVKRRFTVSTWILAEAPPLTHTHTHIYLLATRRAKWHNAKVIKSSVQKLYEARETWWNVLLLYSNNRSQVINCSAFLFVIFIFVGRFGVGSSEWRARAPGVCRLVYKYGYGYLQLTSLPTKKLPCNGM